MSALPWPASEGAKHADVAAAALGVAIVLSSVAFLALRAFRCCSRGVRQVQCAGDDQVAPSAATGAQGDDRAPPQAVAEPGSNYVQVVLEREPGEAWGFAWHTRAYAAQRFLIAGIDPKSPAGRWGADRQKNDLPTIGRGDELLSVNWATNHSLIRRELVVADKVTLGFLRSEAVPPLEEKSMASGGSVVGSLARDAAVRRRPAARAVTPRQHRQLQLQPPCRLQQQGELQSGHQPEPEPWTQSQAQMLQHPQPQHFGKPWLVQQQQQQHQRHRRSYPQLQQQDLPEEEDDDYDGEQELSEDFMQDEQQTWLKKPLSPQPDPRQRPKDSKEKDMVVPFLPLGRPVSQSRSMSVTPGTYAVRRTFVELESEEEGLDHGKNQGVRSRSDPPPLASRGAGSPYRPGCLAGIDLALKVIGSHHSSLESSGASSPSITRAKDSHIGSGGSGSEQQSSDSKCPSTEYEFPTYPYQQHLMHSQVPNFPSSMPMQGSADTSHVPAWHGVPPIPAVPGVVIVASSTPALALSTAGQLGAVLAGGTLPIPGGQSFPQQPHGVATGSLQNFNNGQQEAKTNASKDDFGEGRLDRARESTSLQLKGDSTQQLRPRQQASRSFPRVPAPLMPPDLAACSSGSAQLSQASVAPAVVRQEARSHQTARAGRLGVSGQLNQAFVKAEQAPSFGKPVAPQASGSAPSLGARPGSAPPTCRRHEGEGPPTACAPTVKAPKKTYRAGQRVTAKRLRAAQRLEQATALQAAVACSSSVGPLKLGERSRRAGSAPPACKMPTRDTEQATDAAPKPYYKPRRRAGQHVRQRKLFAMARRAELAAAQVAAGSSSAAAQATAETEAPSEPHPQDEAIPSEPNAPSRGEPRRSYYPIKSAPSVSHLQAASDSLQSGVATDALGAQPSSSSTQPRTAAPSSEAAQLHPAVPLSELTRLRRQRYRSRSRSTTPGRVAPGPFSSAAARCSTSSATAGLKQPQLCEPARKLRSHHAEAPKREDRRAAASRLAVERCEQPCRSPSTDSAQYEAIQALHETSAPQRAAGKAAMCAQATPADRPCDVPFGERVLVTGLVHSPQFNGRWGRVESYDPEMQRYVVRVFLGEEGDANSVLTKLRRETFVRPPAARVSASGEHSVAKIPQEKPKKVQRGPTGAAALPTLAPLPPAVVGGGAGGSSSSSGPPAATVGLAASTPAAAAVSAANRRGASGASAVVGGGGGGGGGGSGSGAGGSSRTGAAKGPQLPRIPASKGGAPAEGRNPNWKPSLRGQRAAAAQRGAKPPTGVAK